MKSKIPFDFILDELSQIDPVVKPMFGCHAVYHEEKILVIVRKKDDHRDDNGIWIATEIIHHDSLRKDFPELRSISLFGTDVTAWQNLPEESDTFESDAMKLCRMILLKDERIGKVPKSKKKKATTTLKKSPKKIS